ncbi:acryloyl-CoA reductase electron transfer subunit beta [Oxobacter pfennigii]|uniref:Acryloyl-CoA reductase electron transfer subunit beta n=1 Tax=Oxobacter pfennigii TaxID=36849 RepID=A0A0P8WYS2_9CLOT|nr:electron transfer flavoprotein subunit alpha [Oxobacter pfennigii]KPU43570.1 acryloyl-CoA reductase electron transfer subunit beta [Oxobacter pfennigii]
MNFIHFDEAKCNLCRECINKCPFQALTMGEKGIEANDACRMCSLCIRTCPREAIYFEQKAGTVDKSQWKDILVYAEQENGHIHPVVFELIGEARRLSQNIGYDVHAVIVGAQGTSANAQKLTDYGVKKVYIYEHKEFEAFKADSFAAAVTDCIAMLRPSVVLLGATSLGRSLAPRLSTRFHTGLTADCTKLMMRENSDLVQIRPAFGGNVMAQILITDSRPQFATVRYKVMDAAKPVPGFSGEVVRMKVTDDLTASRIKVCSVKPLEKKKQIEEEEALVVAGRGVKDEKGLKLLRELAESLGGQLCFTRPMVEAGYGDTAHQIGLSGRTVKPKLIITCGVSGSIQFASCMKNSECIVAIDVNPDALIFNIAHYCIVDDLYEIVPRFLERIRAQKEEL